MQHTTAAGRTPESGNTTTSRSSQSITDRNGPLTLITIIRIFTISATALLILRFLLVLFGVSLTATTPLVLLTDPLVAPFHNIVATDSGSGSAAFETSTLVAALSVVIFGTLTVGLLKHKRNSKME